MLLLQLLQFEHEFAFFIPRHRIAAFADSRTGQKRSIAPHWNPGKHRSLRRFFHFYTKPVDCCAATCRF